MLSLAKGEAVAGKVSRNRCCHGQLCLAIDTTRKHATWRTATCIACRLIRQHACGLRPTSWMIHRVRRLPALASCLLSLNGLPMSRNPRL